MNLDAVFVKQIQPAVVNSYICYIYIYFILYIYIYYIYIYKSHSRALSHFLDYLLTFLSLTLLHDAWVLT